MPTTSPIDRPLTIPFSTLSRRDLAVIEDALIAYRPGTLEACDRKRALLERIRDTFFPCVACGNPEGVALRWVDERQSTGECLCEDCFDWQPYGMI